MIYIICHIFWSPKNNLFNKNISWIVIQTVRAVCGSRMHKYQFLWLQWPQSSTARFSRSSHISQLGAAAYGVNSVCRALQKSRMWRVTGSQSRYLCPGLLLTGRPASVTQFIHRQQMCSRGAFLFASDQPLWHLTKMDRRRRELGNKDEMQSWSRKGSSRKWNRTCWAPVKSVTPVERGQRSPRLACSGPRNRGTHCINLASGPRSYFSF